MHGIAVSPDGSHVYVTGAGNELYDWTVGTNGMVAFSRTISLPGGSYPCGVAISADGTKAYVCLSIANKLAVVNLSTGTVSRRSTSASRPGTWCSRRTATRLTFPTGAAGSRSVET